MYKILLLTRGEGPKDLRQVPNGKDVFLNGKYKLYINESIKDPDFLFIRGKALKSTTSFHVAQANTILLTSEPYNVLSYPVGYCKQFGVVCSCQDQLKLPNVIYTPAMLPWFVGIEFGPDIEDVIRMNYEDIQQSQPQKEKLISVITSNKAFTQGHLDRLRFVEKLKSHYGDRIDVFGRGYKGFADKWDILAPYKYHIVIENSSSKYYWTEKLSDCYLANTYPFYYGCPNIKEYFPEKALSVIDIHNFDESVKCIDKIIEEDTFNKRQNELMLCKKLVMDDYNMFNYIINLCERLDAHAPKATVALKPAKHYFDWHNFYMYSMGRNIFKIKRKAIELFSNNHL